jgi:hypothetical protein
MMRQLEFTAVRTFAQTGGDNFVVRPPFAATLLGMSPFWKRHNPIR